MIRTPKARPSPYAYTALIAALLFLTQSTDLELPPSDHAIVVIAVLLLLAATFVLPVRPASVVVGLTMVLGAVDTVVNVSPLFAGTVLATALFALGVV